MSQLLKREIIKHTLHSFGLLLKTDMRSKDTPVSSRFLLPQKLTFEIDGKKYENSIWSGKADIGGSDVQFIIGDLTEDVSEYALLLQLDSFPPYAARISTDPEDSGSLFFLVEDNWVDAPGIFQARFLVAVESIMEIYVNWEKNDKPNQIHKDLISFLKFETENE